MTSDDRFQYLIQRFRGLISDKLLNALKAGMRRCISSKPDSYAWSYGIIRMLDRE